jgi:hypothetical protein
VVEMLQQDPRYREEKEKEPMGISGSGCALPWRQVGVKVKVKAGAVTQKDGGESWRGGRRRGEEGDVEGGEVGSTC